MIKAKLFLTKAKNWLSVPKHNAPIVWICAMICYAGIITLCILLMAVNRDAEQFLDYLGNILFFLELLPMAGMGLINLVNEPVKIAKVDKPGNTNSKV